MINTVFVYLYLAQISYVFHICIYIIRKEEQEEKREKIIIIIMDFKVNQTCAFYGPHNAVYFNTH